MLVQLLLQVCRDWNLLLQRAIVDILDFCEPVVSSLPLYWEISPYETDMNGHGCVTIKYDDSDWN